MTSRGVTWDHDPSMLVGQSSESRRVHSLNALGEEASRVPSRITVWSVHVLLYRTEYRIRPELLTLTGLLGFAIAHIERTGGLPAV